MEEERQEEIKREAEETKDRWEKELEGKRARLGEEPAEGSEGSFVVVFRKPTGNERI